MSHFDLTPAAQRRYSKFLSLILRHDPGRVGLTLDAAGWVAVDVLLGALEQAGMPLSRAQLDAIVAADTKQRYAFSPEGTHIRASQGHSIPVALGYTPVAPPAWLFHGTVARFLDAIMAEGLRKGQRHHVHLSADVETARQVGGRRGQPVILRVDAGGMAVAGQLFFRSENGVWLTEAVPPAYLTVWDPSLSPEAEG